MKPPSSIQQPLRPMRAMKTRMLMFCRRGGMCLFDRRLIYRVIKNKKTRNRGNFMKITQMRSSIWSML